MALSRIGSDLACDQREGARRQRRRRQRHDNEVSRAYHLRAELVHHWRTVEDNPLVARRKLVGEPRQPVALADVDELRVKRTNALVGGQNIEILVRGLADELFGTACPGKYAFGRLREARLDPEQEARPAAASRSHNSVRLPAMRAEHQARLAASVVLPTPPFTE